MSVIGHSPLAGASGAAGGGDPVYVDDVFSTFLYEGTNSAKTITNGIDLSGEGGLVWIKSRSRARSNGVWDTERGIRKHLKPDERGAETDSGTQYGVQSFNSDGFTLSENWSGENENGEDHVAWTFRKAPKFFDVVTYSGTGSVQNISHSLGSVPGMIMIHCRDGTHDWEVYHRSTGATKSLHLNRDDAQATDSTVWNNTTPTSSVFTVGTSSNVNQNGHGYVAYVFAHDEQSFGTDSDEAIIKCASYTGTGGSVDINVGFEAQWVLIKNISNASDQYGDADWTLYDMMRPFNKTSSRKLHPNTSAADTSGGRVFPTATGFGIDNESNIDFNASGDTYVYMAIRRPHKPPTAGTDVFAANVQTSPNYYKTFTTGFPVDLAIVYKRASSSDKWWFDRLRGGSAFGLESTTTDSESSSNSIEFDRQTTLRETIGFSTTDASGVLLHAFRRAPGVFDIVAADYPSSSAAIPHNLGVAPELIISKPRDGNIGWMVGSDYLQNTNGWNRYFEINSSGSEGGTSTVWNQTAPTATHFTLGSYPGSSYEGVFYLFATLDGISKVGSYSGTGSNINVDCGFTAGARFVLIKRTDSSGDWYVWDSTRGIVSGNDPYLLLNSTAAEVTNTDYIDPLNAGFTVTSSAPAALNTSGGTYLFLAIA
tara:strand:- start:257 stop:2215 length:1959 start_codon:yes stop_codon:yes gene_type:complete